MFFAWNIYRVLLIQEFVQLLARVDCCHYTKKCFINMVILLHR